MKNFLEGARREISGRKTFYFSIFLVICLFLILPIHSTYAADGLLDGIWNSFLFNAEKIIYTILFIVLKTALYVVSFLVNFGAWFIDAMLNQEMYRRVLNSNAINVGWTTVRDFCNMFYVFFLLLIAFSTIIGSQTYSVKNVLPKVIISLFLINFSQVIAKIVIDLGQVFLFGIAGGWMGTFSGSTGAGSGLTAIVNYFQNRINALDTPSFSSIVLVIFAIIYTFMLAFLYIMLALFLLMRLIMFAVLIIVSPFAFFSMVLPSMRKYASQWWGQLFNNAISGPVFIFFIYISAVMARDLADNPIASDSMGNVQDLAFMTPILTVIIPHIVALGMLWAAIPAAKAVGTAGSSHIVGGKWGGLGKVMLGTYAGYKIGEKVAGGTASRIHTAAKNKSENYSKLADLAGKQVTNFAGTSHPVPIVGQAYLVNQANKAQQIKSRVDAHKATMKTFTPEQMAAYANGLIDPRARIEAKQAMMETLMDKGKMTNADLMKAGYVKKTATGDSFDTDKIKKDMKAMGNNGGDVSDVYKQRVDLVADSKDLEKEINKVIDKGEVSKLKLDIMLDPAAEQKIRQLLPKDKFDQWVSNKSQGEKDSYIAQKEKGIAYRINTNQIRMDSDEVKDFRREAAVLSRVDKLVPNNKENYFKDVVGVNTNTWRLATGGNSNPEIYEPVLEKITKSEKLGFSEDFLKDYGHHLSSEDNKHIARYGTETQKDAIKTSLENRLNYLNGLPTPTAAQLEEKVKIAKKKKNLERII